MNLQREFSRELANLVGTQLRWRYLRAQALVNQIDHRSASRGLKRRLYTVLACAKKDAVLLHFECHTPPSDKVKL